MVSTGFHGNEVYQMLANYQQGVEGSVDGGNGFLRIITIDPVNEDIRVQTYSPWIDAYKLDAAYDFEFENVKF